MSKKKICALAVAASLIFLSSLSVLVVTIYNEGRNKGREETVQMITEFTDRYTIGELKDTETGWTLGSFGGTTQFETGRKMLMYDYGFDGKLNVKFMDVK